MSSPRFAPALAPVLVLAFVALAGAAAAQPKAISPGYWETNNKVVSPFPSSKVERRCIKPQDVAKFMEGPSNHIYHCTYPTRVVSDGAIRLKGSCAAKDGKAIPVEGQGTFTADTFHMDAYVAVPFGPLTVPGHAVSDARRLGPDCPSTTDTAAATPPAPTSGDASPPETQTQTQ